MGTETALSPSSYLNEHSEILQILAIPLLKRSQQLQSVTRGRHIHIDAASVARWRLERVLSWVEARLGQLVAEGSGKLEFLACVSGG